MDVRLSNIISPAFYGPYHAIKSGSINELVLEGGRGSTKSSFASVVTILQLLNNPNVHATAYRRYGNTLRSSVYAQICWAIDQMGLASHFRRTVSPMECTYIPTGQKIMFFGLDDPGKIKSIKVPFGYIGIDWFEELDQFDGPEQIRNVEQSTLRGGPYSMTIKSFNPPAMARNWANQYVRERKPGQLVHHSTYLTTPEDWLGPRFIADAEHLKNTNPTGYRHEYLGEVVGSGTQVFENLQLRAITDNEVKQFDRIYNGVDWGFFPDIFAWNRMHYDAARRTLYIYDEVSLLRASNRKSADAIIAKGVTGNDLIIADSAEPKSISDYCSYGLRCRGVKKGPGSVEYRMKWLQTVDCIVIDPQRCPDTAKEFAEYEYERDPKTGEVIEGYPDAANHHIDSVSYGCYPIWKRRGK